MAVSLLYKVLFTLLLVLLFVAMAFFKVTTEARREHQQAEQALGRKNLEEAITHYSRALHWYSPGSAPVALSLERLWEIGQNAERHEDYQLALRAYEDLRSGVYSARSFYTPLRSWIERCDERIADIVAQGKAPRASQQTLAAGHTREEILRILQGTPGPNYVWSIICEAGFIGWIACTFGFILFVFTGEKGFRPRRAVVWGSLIVAFYALWIAGMLRA